MSDLETVGCFEFFVAFVTYTNVRCHFSRSASTHRLTATLKASRITFAYSDGLPPIPRCYTALSCSTSRSLSPNAFHACREPRSPGLPTENSMLQGHSRRRSKLSRPSPDDESKHAPLQHEKLASYGHNFATFLYPVVLRSPRRLAFSMAYMICQTQNREFHTRITMYMEIHIYIYTYIRATSEVKTERGTNEYEIGGEGGQRDPVSTG